MNTQDTKTYSLKEAISKAKDAEKAKFDATIEAHFNLGIDPKKTDQNVRVTTTLPNGTGKTIKVAVFASSNIKDADLQLTESDISKIEKGKIKPHVDFDILVTEPKYMPKVAKIARILGPQGVMPSPKAGTVTDDVQKTVDQIKKGRVELKNEQNAPIIHTIIGKQSFDNKKLEENFKEILSTLNHNRPQKVKKEAFINSCFICSSMSPSFKLDANSLA